jgi:histidyl-tRNA synthetase
MAEIIEPRTLRGFRDSLPQTEILKEEIQQRLAGIFRLHGFVPIDTPALEYAEILLGKGGGETDKQVYRFLDHGQRDVALRFDLTVPFARFMAAHVNELVLPFKRYHMAKVWRGENTQRGRYREFIQIDFDIVGVDAASADFETVVVMQEAMRALGVQAFCIHLSHRELFNQFLTGIGLGEAYGELLRTIDKLKKLGEEKIEAMLAPLAGAERARKILDFVRPGGSNQETLDRMAEAVPRGSAALARLREIQRCVEETGLERHVHLDPSITRGLDYYTGVVFETFLDELPGIGSVCSGGRYNNLASLYTREELPGVGSSIGLDRLLSALEDLKLLPGARAAPDVLVLCLEESLLGSYHRIAGRLRQAGLAAEVYPLPRKLAIQLKYAERRGIPLALFHGEAERASGLCNLRSLASRETFDGLTVQAAADTALRLLRS